VFFIKKITKKQQADDKEPELYPFQNNTMMALSQNTVKNVHDLIFL